MSGGEVLGLRSPIKMLTPTGLRARCYTVRQLWSYALAIRILDSAHKHGITDTRIRFVIEHCGLAFIEPPPDDPTEPDRMLILGDDQGGIPLEVLAVEDAGGDLVVIHAMKMRRRYRRQYEEALPWRTVL